MRQRLFPQGSSDRIAVCVRYTVPNQATISFGVTMQGESRFAPIDFKTRFPALDGIRALAVTMVFLHHFASGAQGHEGVAMKLIHAMDRRFWSGVDLFFVLSGFLITGILYDTRSDSRFFQRFYARRSLRIFPVFYLVAAVLLVLTPFFRYEWHWQHMMYLLYVGGYFAMPRVISANHPQATLFIGHFWSLCLEEQFYLVWPVLVWLIRDRVKLIRFALGGAVLALILRLLWCLHMPTPGVWIIVGLPFRMDSLLLGGALALLLRGPRADLWQRNCRWLFWGSLATAVAILAKSDANTDKGTLLLTLGLTATAATSVGLIGMVLPRGTPLFRFFCLPPLRVVGKFSYSFYIFHMLWLTAWSALPDWLGPKVGSHALGGILSLAANYLLTLLVAKLSYDLYEVKFLKLKRFFEYDSEVKQHVHPYAAT